MLISSFITGMTRLAIFLCLLSSLNAQVSPDSLLRLAGDHYHADALDSAVYYYREVFREKDPEYKLRAISGLLKIASFQNDSVEAARWIEDGDSLAGTMDFSESVSHYFSVKGEFLKKYSRLREALALHKENVQKSADLEDRSLYADALLYTALTFEKLSRYDSAFVYAEQAHSIFSEVMDTTSVRYGGICNSLGVCYFRANRYDEARAFYEKAIRIAESKLSPISSDLSYAYMNLAVILSSENNYEDAIIHMEHSMRINRVLNDRDALSSNYYSLGVYYYYLGDYGRARDFLEACIRLRKEIYNDRHYRLIWPYQVLSITTYEAGDYDAAISQYMEAAGLLRHNFGPGSLDEGMLYENLALSYRHMGKLDSALHYIALANRILPQTVHAADNALPLHYFSLAGIQYEAGYLAEALGNIKKSTELLKSRKPIHKPDLAQNLAMHALIEAGLGHYGTADRLFEEALQVIGPDNRMTMTPQTFQVLGHYLKYNYTRYSDTGERSFLDRFKNMSESYNTLSDEYRKQFHDPYTKSILIRHNAEVFRNNIGIFNALYSQTKDPSYIEASFRAAEHNRTTMLRDMMDSRLTGSGRLPDSLAQREKILRHKISALNQASLEHPDSSEIKNGLFEAREAFNSHLAEIELHYPSYYEARFSGALPTLSEVQALLAEREAVIEYMQDDTAYYGLVISRDAPVLTHLGSIAEVNALVTQWRELLMRKDRHAFQVLTGRLYDMLLAPLAIGDKFDRLVIIPAGKLYYLSFEALHHPVTGRYLIEDHIIRYSLSANMFAQPSPSPDRGGDALALAFIPGFEDDMKRAYVKSLDSLEAVDDDFLHTLRQPWSLRLAEELKREYRNKAFTGNRATESNVKAEIGQGHVLFFGTHAIPDGKDPLRSRLVLAKEAGPQTEDGYLHAYEIYGMDLRADLAILTACESGVGQLKEGEGMISLAYSLNFAGCPSTIMSLWKIDERTNAHITGTFFRYLAEGMDRSEALRQAKLDLLLDEDPVLRHPYYWAGQVLTGLDGPVYLPKKNNLWLWLAGAGVLLGIIFLLVRIKNP